MAKKSKGPKGMHCIRKQRGKGGVMRCAKFAKGKSKKR